MEGLDSDGCLFEPPVHRERSDEYTLRAHHQECIFHIMRMRPQKRALVAAPFWAQADWLPNAFSTTELWGNQLQRQRIMFGKACGSETGKGC